MSDNTLQRPTADGILEEARRLVEFDPSVCGDWRVYNYFVDMLRNNGYYSKESELADILEM